MAAFPDGRAAPYIDREPIARALRRTRNGADEPGNGATKVLSNLKSLLETGAIALLEPYPKAP
jgi:hypothetical protein